MTPAEADLFLLSSCPPCWHGQISHLELEQEAKVEGGIRNLLVLCEPGDAETPPGMQRHLWGCTDTSGGVPGLGGATCAWVGVPEQGDAGDG